MIDQGDDGNGCDTNDTDCNEAIYQAFVSCGSDSCKQAAIRFVMDIYHIGTAKYINGTPTYDPNFSDPDARGHASPDGTVTIGSLAFDSTSGRLAATIAHEGVHAMQAQEGRYYPSDDLAGTTLNELEARDYVIATADDYNLSEAQVTQIQTDRDAYARAFLLGSDYINRASLGIYTLSGDGDAISNWLYWLETGRW